MAELGETIDAALTPLIAKVEQIAKDIPGVRWATGLRIDLTHDEVRAKDGRLNIAVGPGLPIPISGGFESGFSRSVHNTSSISAYFLFSSPDAPTIDAPLGTPGVIAGPVAPGGPTTDGTPTQPLNVGGDPAAG